MGVAPCRVMASVSILPSLGLALLLQPLRLVLDTTHAVVLLASCSHVAGRRGDTAHLRAGRVHGAAFVAGAAIACGIAASVSPAAASRLGLAWNLPWWMLTPRLLLAWCVGAALLSLWRQGTNAATLQREGSVLSPREAAQGHPYMRWGLLVCGSVLTFGALTHPAPAMLLLSLGMMADLPALSFSSAQAGDDGSSRRRPGGDGTRRLCQRHRVTDSSLLVACMGLALLPGASAYQRALWSQHAPVCGTLPYAPAVCFSGDARRSFAHLLAVSVAWLLSLPPSHNEASPAEHLLKPAPSARLPSLSTASEALLLGSLAILALCTPTFLDGFVRSPATGLADEDPASSDAIAWAALKGVLIVRLL